MARYSLFGCQTTYMKFSTIKTAFMAFVTLGTFFMILDLFGLSQFSELRFFNLAIVIYFSNIVAKQNRLELLDKGYFQNFISLFRFNMLIVALSMIAIFVFTKYIDATIISQPENFLTIIHVETSAELLFALFAEGLSASIVVSYGILQYWKNIGLSSRGKSLDEYLKT